MKDKMTSFDIAALTSHINHLIEDTYINKIYQTNPSTILLRLRRSDQPRFNLLLEAGKRFNLTQYIQKKPKKPPSFCMALRKHLRNSKIKEIRQHEFERIVILEVVTRKKEKFELVFELFGEGNIILVSPENRILQALNYRRMRDRNIVRGEFFQHPPSSGRNPLILERQGFYEIKELGRLEIVRALTKFLSIGGLYAEEVLTRAEINKNTLCNSLRENELDRIFNQLKYILSIIETRNLKPRITFNEDGEKIDVTPLPLQKHSKYDQKDYETFNEAIDDYYTDIIVKKEVFETSKRIERESARYQRILQKQKKALIYLKNEIERNKNIGNIIYRHLGDLQPLLQKILKEKRNDRSWEEIILDIEKEKKAGSIPNVYFYSFEALNLILNVSVENVLFPINIRCSLQANANNYYVKAKKNEKKLKGVQKVLRETKYKLEELQQIGQITESQEHAVKIKRREKAWYEKFRWFYSSDGFLVIGGRDASTNEILIKKYMKSHDIVLHADISGAPFVLIQTSGNTQHLRTINEAAQLAASYSRAWKEMMSLIDVYWITPEQVKKSPPSGQYLKKGTFMIHGSKNYIRSVPLQIAIGVKMEKEHAVIIGGPVEAITNQTNFYVEIIPGELKSSSLGKQIRKLLVERVSKDLKKKILEIPIEEIQSFIPLGRGKIAKRHIQMKAKH